MTFMASHVRVELNGGSESDHSPRSMEAQYDTSKSTLLAVEREPCAANRGRMGSWPCEWFVHDVRFMFLHARACFSHLPP